MCVNTNCAFLSHSAVSASAQLLEQTARLQSLSDALDKLKVRSINRHLGITQFVCIYHFLYIYINFFRRFSHYLRTKYPSTS